MIPRFKKFRGLKYADVVDRFQDAQPITQYSEGIESRACLQNSYFTQALSKIETTFQVGGSFVVFKTPIQCVH